MDTSKIDIENQAAYQTVHAIRITDYLDWICPTNQDPIIERPLSGLIVLPPIQRGSVWKPSQIINLWDSLLRGMPIGCFTLSKLKLGDYCRPVNGKDSKTEKASEGGFNLLDGQQRTLAMLLGWPYVPKEKSMDRRIWIDLSKSEQDNGSPFQLRITTKSQPFGYQPWNPDLKLSLPERRKARQRFEKNNEQSHWTSEKNGQRGYRKKYDHELDINKTRPWISKEEQEQYLVKLTDLWLMYRHIKNVDLWANKILEEIKIGFDEKTRSRLIQLGKALDRIEKNWIALVLVPPELDEPERSVSNPAHHPMMVLFDRIARSGTKISQDELIFSLIKQIYPKAHDIVHEIHNRKDENDQLVVGHLLKDTDIVMTIVRLACIDNNLVDKATPSIIEFQRYLEKLDIKKHFNKIAEGTPPPFVNYFIKLNKLLAYRPQQGVGIKRPLDPGLPHVFMPFLGRQLVQVLLLWLHQATTINLEDSRNEILRFVLFWCLCVKDPNKASERAFNFLIKNKPAIFPGKELYIELRRKDERDYSPTLLLAHPQMVDGIPAVGTNSPLITKWNERFQKDKEQTESEALFAQWWNMSSMLLWLQRDYLSKAFEAYVPLARRNEGWDQDTPYDFDHICPKAHWEDGRSVRCIDSCDPQTREHFSNLWSRKLLGNSIGNYRIWDSSLNRSDSDDLVSNKMGLNSEPDENWSGNDAFPVTTVGEMWEASVFSSDKANRDLWHRASGEKGAEYSWSDERIAAFQQAVEQRTLWLYKRFFNELGLESWIPESMPSS